MRHHLAALLAGTAFLLIGAAAHAADAAAPRPPALLAALDGDQDGRFTLDEMRGARHDQMTRFDLDRDGHLSAAEYQTLWLETAQARLARAFAADDLDHDGAVSVDELIERSTALLRRRDGDKDGALTAEELRPRRRSQPAG